jgi:hypothetical protein
MHRTTTENGVEICATNLAKKSKCMSTNAKLAVVYRVMKLTDFALRCNDR